MGFVRNLAKVGTFGLAGMAMAKDKKREPMMRSPSMISNMPMERPTSMIGPRKGG